MDKHKLQVCKTPDSRAKGTTGSMPRKAPRASPRNAQSLPSEPSEAAVVLCPAAFARFLSIWVDLFPRSPPPHAQRCTSYLSELRYHHQTPSAPNNHTNNDKNSQVSLGSTNKRSKLPLILTFDFLKSDNGGRLLVYNNSERTAILRHRAGRKTMSSMGSTSSAMTTSAAFLASMRATMWLRPYLPKRGFLESCLYQRQS